MSSSNKFNVSAPSNIAFIKYWGKYGRQFPLNPSISLTLNDCRTVNQVEFDFSSERNNLDLTYSFENQINDQFCERVKKYLTSIEDIFPFINNLKLKINSHNTFPHSAGIASSASSFCALAAAVVNIEKLINNNDHIDNERLSMAARLGSGSAGRSVSGPMMSWGEIKNFGGTNDFARVENELHEDFLSLCDSILIIDGAKKDIGSSAGHSLMNAHPFKENRILQANENIVSILNAMKNGDWDLFGEVLENEALTLHALMMSSYPSFTLLKPNSLVAIEKIKDFRSQTKLPLYFTIDAGPNIHLIYPEKEKQKIHSFITEELKVLCQNELVIHDNVGSGVEFHG